MMKVFMTWVCDAFSSSRYRYLWVWVVLPLLFLVGVVPVLVFVVSFYLFLGGVGGIGTRGGGLLLGGGGCCRFGRCFGGLW